MISLKAFAAISLTGLGAAAMSADVYLASRARTPQAPSSTEPRTQRSLAPRAVRMTSEPQVVNSDTAVTLAPVTIYSRAPAARVRHKVAPTRELVPCSDWRSLGAVGHGVRQLCPQDSPAGGAP